MAKQKFTVKQLVLKPKMPWNFTDAHDTCWEIAQKFKCAVFLEMNDMRVGINRQLSIEESRVKTWQHYVVMCRIRKKLPLSEQREGGQVSTEVPEEVK